MFFVQTLIDTVGDHSGPKFCPLSIFAGKQTVDGLDKYLDPPYKMGNCRLYLGRFDHSRLFNWLEKQKGGYAMSLNGFIGDVDHRMDVPERLFDEELLIENGTSALHQLNGAVAPRLRDALYLRLR